MEVLQFTTENPESDQWRMLLQYSYPANIQRYFKEHHSTNAPKEIEDCISGCFRQGEAYFRAAEKSPIDIAPLLIYYGTTNLLRAAFVMLKGQIPVITDHGMTLKIPLVDNLRIADVEVKPVNKKTGALQIFADEFSNKINIVDGSTWKLEEVLSLVPELKRDFENCYETAASRTIPLELVKRRECVPPN